MMWSCGHYFAIKIRSTFSASALLLLFTAYVHAGRWPSYCRDRGVCYIYARLYRPMTIISFQCHQIFCIHQINIYIYWYIDTRVLSLSFCRSALCWLCITFSILLFYCRMVNECACVCVRVAIARLSVFNNKRKYNGTLSLYNWSCLWL